MYEELVCPLKPGAQDFNFISRNICYLQVRASHDGAASGGFQTGRFRWPGG